MADASAIADVGSDSESGEPGGPGTVVLRQLQHMRELIDRNAGQTNIASTGMNNQIGLLQKRCSSLEKDVSALQQKACHMDEVNCLKDLLQPAQRSNSRVAVAAGHCRGAVAADTARAGEAVGTGGRLAEPEPVS